MGENGDMVEKREPGPKKRDNIVSTGLPPDTFRDFEEYRDANNLNSKSEAAQRVFRSGLKTEQSEGTFFPRRRIPLLFAFGLIMYVNSPPAELELIIWGVGTALLIVSTVLEIRHYRK